ncbi:MAG: YqgE/AlgH family protein [Desulfobulbaceae bacterium]|nr:YqgE/AlgH family protein [Desulfobulbaceae bacterium]HIJ77840.1 YqgE/AlgH family protein [Deltaproteobacteria bacterium]
MQSLQGYFLIATPQMPDPRFAEKVIYICAHNEEGAMGLVVNEPISELSLAEIFVSADIEIPKEPLPSIYAGGPVETAGAFFLYDSGYETANFLKVSSTVHLTRDPQILYDISIGAGPKNFLAALGYSGWGPGQLENELTVEGWLTLPATDDIIFKTPDHIKWQKAAKLYGIDISLFGDVVGTA